ncbi:MAG: hypothetical protein AAB571_07560 [Chloroflexota bacterium]
MTTVFPETKVKRVLSVVESFAVAAAEDKAYWLSRTPHQRLEEIEDLRRINYGNQATARLQRVLEITQRSPR